MDRTIRRDFPDYGDNAYVTIKNPIMCPQSKLLPPRTPKPNNVKDAVSVTAEWLTFFVVDWHLEIIDADNWDAEPTVLGEPSVSEFMKVPGPVSAWIAETVNAASPDPS